MRHRGLEADREIILVAAFAGKLRRPGVRPDIEGAGLEHVRDDGFGDVGEDRAGDDLDLFSLQEPLGDALGIAGIHRSIFAEQLHRHAAQLAVDDSRA